MKIAILGSGVIGTTTAYYLARHGHHVTVLERRDGPAEETSFANAGQVSPGYAAPWAAPGLPLQALKWLIQRDAPLILRPPLDLATLRWMAQFLANCSAERYAQNKARMVRVAAYSRACLEDLRSSTGLAYDAASKGTLQLFRTQAQLAKAAKDVDVLRAAGMPFEMLSPDGCLAAEPGLVEARDQIVGGLRLPQDETGDCYKFTTALAALARDAGVIFRFGTTVEGFESRQGRIVYVATSAGSIDADAYVVALGSATPRLLAPLGLRLPIVPVKGYSLTLSIDNVARAPVSTVLDESYKVAITRLGDRLRIGGMAEIAGFSLKLPPARRMTLELCVAALFPGVGDLRSARFWCGLRPMTPDGTPIIGETTYSNLFINSGHGTLGWTMACGSARVLSDIISGKTPEIDVSDLGLARYDRK